MFIYAQYSGWRSEKDPAKLVGEKARLQSKHPRQEPSAHFEPSVRCPYLAQAGEFQGSFKRFGVDMRWVWGSELYGCFCKVGVLSVGALVIKALGSIFHRHSRVFVGAPDFLELPHGIITNIP